MWFPQLFQKCFNSVVQFYDRIKLLLFFDIASHSGERGANLKQLSDKWHVINAIFSFLSWKNLMMCIAVCFISTFLTRLKRWSTLKSIYVVTADTGFFTSPQQHFWKNFYQSRYWVLNSDDILRRVFDFELSLRSTKRNISIGRNHQICRVESLNSTSPGWCDGKRHVIT